MEKELQIKEEGRPPFTSIPNVIDDWGLDPYAFRLYVRIKRRAGDNGGACWESTRSLAKSLKMSVGMVSKAKRELQHQGLIRIETAVDEKTGNEYHVITIVNVWKLQQPQPKEPLAAKSEQPAGDRSPGEHQTRSPGEPPRSPGELKKNPLRRTHEEEPVVVEKATPTTKTPSSTDELYERAARLYTEITGFATVAPSNADWLPVLSEILENRYGGNMQRAAQALRLYFAEYKLRRNKNGSYYRPTGMGWVEWAQAGAIPAAAQTQNQELPARKPTTLERNINVLAQFMED